MNDDPAFLSVGTDVSAKYKGAFCEAKIKKVVKNIKCKVTLKSGGGGTLVVPDDAIKGTLRVGNTVEVRNEAKKETAEAILTKIQDCSQYTVVFDDGDITTLRRSALCLKSGRHFADGETLDQLPLTHPEHFSSPVIGHSAGRRGRRAQRSQSEERRAWEGEGWVREREPHAGRVVLVEAAGGPQERRRPQPPWFPGLVVAPTAQDTVKIRIQDDYLVRSFKDGRYYTVPKKEAREFKKGSGPQDVAGIEAALQYLNAGVLPPHWDRDVLFGTDQIGKNDDGNSDDSSDDEPREEKDHFVAQLYKFMDDRGTPLNRQPTIANKDVDLYRLFKVVHKMGGFNRVTNQNQWRSIAIRLGFQPVSTSVTNLCKQAYKKNLHSFEEFYRKLGVTLVAHPRGSRQAPAGRSLIRDRDRAPPTPGGPPATPPPPPAAPPVAAAPVAAPTPAAAPVTAPPAPPTPPAARPPIAPDRPPEAPPEEPKPAAKVEKIVTSDEDDSGDSKPLAIARAEKPVKITKPPPDKPEKAASTKLSEKSVPSKPDKTSTPKASDKPSSKSTDKVTTAKSSEKSAVKTEKSTIVKAEKLEKTKASEKTAPLKAEKSTPLKTEKSTPLKSEKSAPLKTEKSTLLKTEKSTSLKTEKSTPLKTEKSTPLKTEKSNTSKTIEKVSNLKSSEKSATPKPEKSGSSKSSERSAPTKVTSEKVAAAKSERTAPPTKAVEKTTAPKQSDKPTPKPERVSQSKSAELPPASAPKPLERSSSTKSLERSNSSKSLDRAPNKAKKPEESLPKKVDKKAKSEPVKEESDNVETRRRSIGKREGKQESSEDSSLAPNAKRRALIKDRRNRSTSAKRSLSEKDKPRTATSSENQDSDSSSRGSRSGSKLGKRMPIIKRKSSKILTGPIKPPVKRKSTETAPDEEEIDLPAPGGTPLTADIGDRLRVYYGPTLDLKVTYEAKVTEVQERDGERMLRVHYTGWNIRYDEWIKATRIAVNLTQYAKSKHKDGSGSKKARASATAYKVMTRNKNASSPPSNPSISGRDFDLNEIRSELKGFEKAVKSPPSIAEDPTVIKLEAEEPEHPEEDVEMRPEDPAPVEMMRENDDIYEFKEPEPFEFEVRKSDEIKKRPQPHILFDDLPPDENTSPRSRDGSSSPEKNDDEDLSDAPKSSEEARDRVTLAMFNESAEEDSGDRLVISEAEDSQEPLFTYQPELFPAEKTYLPTFKGLSGETSAFPKTSEADRKSPSLKEEQSSDEDPINAAIERVNSQSVSDESSDDDDIAKPTNSVVPKLLSPVINEPDGDSQFSNRVETPEPKPADTTTTEPKSPILAYEESKLEPPPDDAPVAETIEPKSDDEANDSPKEETADRSDSDVDVIIPEPPAGFLLHKESIADKVLKALSDAKNAALAPPPTEEKPPTPSLAETDAISTAIEQIADKSGSPEEAKDPVLETPAPDNPASEEDKSDVVAKPSSPAPEKPAPDSIVPSPADSATESSITTIPNRKPSSGGELSSKNNVLSETILKLSTQINMSTTPALPDSDEDTDDSFDKLIIDRAPSEDSDSPVGSSSENDPAPESQDTVKPDWPSALPGSPSVEREREREREKELGNISLLLCSETIPGSPPGAGGAGGAGAAAAGGEGAAPPARPPRAPRRHMPFASAPCNSPPEERDPQIPNNVPLPVRMARNVANHEQQNDEDRRDENSGRVITTPDSSDGSVADEQVPSDHSSAEDKDEDQMSRSSKKHNQKLDPNKPLSSWRRQKASSEEDLSPSTTGPSGTPAERSESSANVPSAPRRGRRPRRTSEVGEPLPGPSSTLAANASAAPVNPQYNFLLDLGADDLPCAKKIAIITKRMADLSRTFNSFKTELMTIDRRRKKLRRKEREG